MKVFLLLLAAIVRPPEPVVPFQYDPNMVDCEILKVFEFEPDPNFIFFMPMKAYEEDGQNVTLTCNDSQVWIPPPSTVIDPNGVAVHRWICDVRPGAIQRVIYLKFTATDNDPQPMKDERMILINVKKKNRQPILDWDG
jgi:hypothetical protein